MNFTSKATDNRLPDGTSSPFMRDFKCMTPLEFVNDKKKYAVADSVENEASIRESDENYFKT